jgi:murein DD-endopeptidase MepM/ murein hydrolase activator NlpD
MQFSKIQAVLSVLAQVSFLMAACAPVLTTPAATEAIFTVEATVSVLPSPTPSILIEIAGDSPEEPAILPSEFILLPSICSPLAVQPLETIAEITTQPFSAPRQLDDGTYKDDGHHGLDLGYYTRNGVPFTGTPVFSATNGRIAAIFHDRPPYGDTILIETPYEQIPIHLIEASPELGRRAESISSGDSLYVLYAHLQNMLNFTLGQEITCGDPLAETGLTGYTSGPHLHFETRWGPAGQTFESMAYYEARTTEEERANYATWRMSGTFRLFDPMILLSTSPEN